MTTAGELLDELTRLNRAGLINDEEYAVLRGVLRSGGRSKAATEEFARLFLTKTPRPPEDDNDRAWILDGNFSEERKRYVNYVSVWLRTFNQTDT